MLSGLSRVLMFIDPGRDARLVADITAATAANHFFGAAAAKLVGRLMFTLSWAAGAFGKCAIQPLFAAIHDTGALPMSGAVVVALVFFASALMHLRPQSFCAASSLRRRPVLIWTDAMYSKDASNGGAQIGFNVFLPDRSSDERWAGRWLHGSAKVPASFIGRFMTASKTYIGQLELLAAVAVYYTLPPCEIEGRAVIHWIDNTGALAAMIKGYARAIDGARIVHAFAALAVTLGISPWFEYVRSEANIADLPSREGLEGYESFDDTEFAKRLGSARVQMRLPPMEAWSAPFGRWIDEARASGARAKRKGAQRKKRPRT